jgi:hypothetical protein
MFQRKLLLATQNRELVNDRDFPDIILENVACEHANSYGDNHVLFRHLLVDLSWEGLRNGRNFPLRPQTMPISGESKQKSADFCKSALLSDLKPDYDFVLTLKVRICAGE